MSTPGMVFTLLLIRKEKQEIQKKMSSLEWCNERKYALDAIPDFVIN